MHFQEKSIVLFFMCVFNFFNIFISDKKKEKILLIVFKIANENDNKNQIFNKMYLCVAYKLRNYLNQ